MYLVCLLLLESLPFAITPAILLAFLLLLLFRDVPGMSAIAGVPAVAITADVASVPAAFACP
jgi:hypothetical protein